jgi:chromosome segregation ATPase
VHTRVFSSEEQERNEEKRRANREAAKRCRQRKQKKTEQLEQQVKELQATLSESNSAHQETEAKFEKCRNELNQMKRLLKKHITEDKCVTGCFSDARINETLQFLAESQPEESDMMLGAGAHEMPQQQHMLQERVQQQQQHHGHGGFHHDQQAQQNAAMGYIVKQPLHQPGTRQRR